MGHLQDAEEILLLYDDTFWKSAKRGIVFTGSRIVAKGSVGGWTIPYGELVSVSTDGEEGDVLVFETEERQFRYECIWAEAANVIAGLLSRLLGEETVAGPIRVSDLETGEQGASPPGVSGETTQPREQAEPTEPDDHPRRQGSHSDTPSEDNPESPPPTAKETWAWMDQHPRKAGIILLVVGVLFGAVAERLFGRESVLVLPFSATSLWGLLSLIFGDIRPWTLLRRWMLSPLIPFR